MSKEESGLDRNFAIELEIWECLSSAVAGLVFCCSGVLYWSLFLRKQHKHCNCALLHKTSAVFTWLNPASVWVTASFCLQPLALVFILCFFLQCFVFYGSLCVSCAFGQQAVVSDSFMPECWTDSSLFNGIFECLSAGLQHRFVFSVVIEDRFILFPQSPDPRVQKQGGVFLDYSVWDEYFIVLAWFYIWMTTHPQNAFRWVGRTQRRGAAPSKNKTLHHSCLKMLHVVSDC